MEVFVFWFVVEFVFVVGHFVNSHFGPDRPTQVPSGHKTASAVHGGVELLLLGSEEFAFVVGHSVNSHFGPLRPTNDPSGQSFASRVHTTVFVFLLLVAVLVDFLDPSGLIAVSIRNKNATMANAMIAITRGVV